jgi:hypothetical protein
MVIIIWKRIKERGGLTEKRAGRMALRAEAFFCLDFLGTFVSRQKYLAPPGQEGDRVSYIEPKPII